MVWYWGTGGAGVRLADRIAEALAVHLGTRAVMMSCHADNAWLERGVSRGHPVATISGAKGYANRFLLALAFVPRLVIFWRQLRAHRPDAVVIPMNFALAWPLAHLPHRMGIPVIYVIHDAEPHVGDFAPHLQRWTQERLLGLASAGVAASNYTASRLHALFAKCPPVTVLPLSSLVKARRVLPRQRPGRPLRILFLGRLIAYKGLDILASALQPLAFRDDWTLTVAGDGPERHKVERLFSPFPQADLSRLRLLLEDEIEELVATHDVVICPYIEASQSGAVPEAQADGLPCIVTPVGALAEQIGGSSAGWLAEAATPEALRHAILQALESSEQDYETRSASALKHVGDGNASRVLSSVIHAAVMSAGRSRV